VEKVVRMTSSTDRALEEEEKKKDRKYKGDCVVWVTHLSTCSVHATEQAWIVNMLPARHFRSLKPEIREETGMHCLHAVMQEDESWVLWEEADNVLCAEK
jgi:hypothetical protein